MFKSIRIKTIVLFVLLSLVIQAVVGGIGIYRSKRSFHSSFDKAVAEVFTAETRSALTDAATAVSVAAPPDGSSEIIMNETGPDNVSNIADIVTSRADSLFANTSAVFYILDKNGATVYTSEYSGPAAASETIQNALNGKESKNNKISSTVLEYALPIMSGNEVRYVVYIKDTLTAADLTKRILTKNLAYSLILSLALSLAVSMLLSRIITRPMRMLAIRAKRLADGDFNAVSRTDRTDELGELTNALIYLSDARRTNADKVTAEKNKIEKILRNMNDGILAFDMKGRLTHINPEAQRLLNRKFVDDIAFNRFFKEINIDITLEELQYAPSEDQTEREIHFNNQLLQFSFAMFSRESSEGGVIVIIHDVTKHERLETARRNFVADVSHELRTPLTVIKSYADILADTPDAEPEVRTRFLDTISSETDRMTKIISDLLTLSKLDEDANYVRPSEDIDIRSMLEGLVERLSITAKKKDQKLSYTPINDVPHIKGDRDGLERVFTNIITNALKYTPTGGEIRIFSSVIYNDIVIKVSDNGIGIPKDQLPHIFDRFYRVDKARSRDKGGTGLGLAIAKETVENSFNGKILITSELNKGTDVSVTIPKK